MVQRSYLLDMDRNGHGPYVLSCSNLGKPVLDPMPVTEWSLEKLSKGAP
jgi:hypothetical protein